MMQRHVLTLQSAKLTSNRDSRFPSFYTNIQVDDDTIEHYRRLRRQELIKEREAKKGMVTPHLNIF
jgi:hypothetical protein